MKSVLVRAAVMVTLLSIGACGTPGVDGLRDAFAQQLGANRFIKDFQQNGDEMTFSGPGAEGGVASWRVEIESAVVEPTSDPDQPYKGTVKSTWYSDDAPVHPRGRDSNLPIELTDNGLSQDCWAFWDPVAKRWSWE